MSVHNTLSFIVQNIMTVLLAMAQVSTTRQPNFSISNSLIIYLFPAHETKTTALEILSLNLHFHVLKKRLIKDKCIRDRHKRKNICQ